MKNLYLLLSSILLTSCGLFDVDYHMPSSFGLTPETRGETFRGTVDVDYHSSYKVVLEDTFQFSILSIPNNGRDINSSSGLGLNASLGIIERLDAYIGIPFKSSNIYGLKFQFWGDPELQYSKGLKVAVAAGIGFDDVDDGETTINGDTIRSEIELMRWDSHILVGYRPSPSIIFYSDIFYSHYDAEADLATSSNGTSLVDLESYTYGVNIGLKANKAKDKDIYYKLEFGHSLGKLEGFSFHNKYNWLGAVGFNW